MWCPVIGCPDFDYLHFRGPELNFSIFFVNCICMEHSESIHITFMRVDIWTVVSGHKVSDFCPDWKFSGIRLFSMYTTVGQQKKSFTTTLESVAFVGRDFEKMEEFWD